MDSITQFTLGASVGYLVGGKEYGRKAAARGAFLGTVPDLDVFIGPLLHDHPIDASLFHRGTMHSLLFCVIAAPFFGTLISRLHEKKPLSFWEKIWNKGTYRTTLLAFLCLVTHPLLDMFTNYGTQFLLPFSDVAIARNSIFILDPLYTLPLIIGLGISLRRRSSTANTGGLIISCIYLIAGLTIQNIATTQFNQSIKNTNLELTQVSVEAPTPFLRKGLAQDDNHRYYAWWSIFDTVQPDFDTKTPKNTALVEPFNSDPRIQRVMNRRRNFVSYEAISKDILRMHIMSFGKLLGRHRSGGGSFMFSYTIEKKNDGTITIQSGNMGKARVPSNWREILSDRMMGKTSIKEK